MSFFETRLLEYALLRCLQDDNQCNGIGGKACGDEETCECACDMQAYLDEARHALVGGSGK